MRTRVWQLAVPASVLLTAALLACSGGAEPAPSPPAAEETASPTPPEVVILEPRESVALGEGFAFRWQAPDAVTVSGWTVRVFGDQGIPLWTSPEMQGTELVAPAELTRRLEPGGVYSWRVIGRLADGGRVRSAARRLAVR